MVWRPKAEWNTAEEVPPQVTPQVTPQVSGEIGRLVTILRGEMKRADIQDALGLKDRKHFQERYLRPALDAGLVEMTLPDKPMSSRQKYRLTAPGQALLKTDQAKKE